MIFLLCYSHQSTSVRPEIRFRLQQLFSDHHLAGLIYKIVNFKCKIVKFSTSGLLAVPTTTWGIIKIIFNCCFLNLIAIGRYSLPKHEKVIKQFDCDK